jgi:hypothetical protein
MSTTYQIGGKTWTQRPLVLGQVQQLLTVIRGLMIPPGASVLQLVEILGDRLPIALAVVLVEDGKDIRERVGIRVALNNGVMVPEWYQNPEKMAEIASEIFAGIDAETTIKVVADFLACNPVSGLLDQLIGLMEKGSALMPLIGGTGLTPSSASSPEATSPSATESSGDTPQESASPTSNTTSES